MIQVTTEERVDGTFDWFVNLEVSRGTAATPKEALKQAETAAKALKKQLGKMGLVNE